jgi:hypothetical protein
MEVAITCVYVGCLSAVMMGDASRSRWSVQWLRCWFTLWIFVFASLNRRSVFQFMGMIVQLSVGRFALRHHVHGLAGIRRPNVRTCRRNGLVDWCRIIVTRHVRSLSFHGLCLNHDFGGDSECFLWLSYDCSGFCCRFPAVNDVICWLQSVRGRVTKCWSFDPITSTTTLNCCCFVTFLFENSSAIVMSFVVACW